MGPKFNKNVMWLEPYVNSVKHLIPLQRINRIRGYSISLDKCELQEASITRPLNKKKFNISIKLKNNDYFKNKQKSAFIAQILSHLAHELAHVVHFSHKPRHLALEAKILLCFARKADKMGVKDLWVRHKQKKEVK